MTGSSSPFGQYAGLVAALAALAVMLAWLGGAAGIGGMAPPSPELSAAFYIVLGAVFGTGAGALVVANGVGRQAAAANTRLDAMNVPSGPTAAAMVDRAAAAASVKPADGAAAAEFADPEPPDYNGGGAR